MTPRHQHQEVRQAKVLVDREKGPIRLPNAIADPCIGAKEKKGPTVLPHRMRCDLQIEEREIGHDGQEIQMAKHQ